MIRIPVAIFMSVAMIGATPALASARSNTMISSSEIEGSGELAVETGGYDLVFVAAHKGITASKVARKISAAFVACIGGMLGIDQIEQMLQRRFSVMVLAKFAAKRVGIFVAIGCATSAFAAASAA